MFLTVFKTRLPLYAIPSIFSVSIPSLSLQPTRRPIKRTSTTGVPTIFHRMSSQARRIKYKTCIVSQLNLFEELEKIMPEEMKTEYFTSLRLPEFTWSYRLNMQQMNELKNAEILLIDNTLLPDLLYALPNLKWAHSTWAGVEGVFKALDPSKPKPSFQLTRHSGEGFGDAMAEYVICQVLNCERKFSLMWDAQKERKWLADMQLYNYRGLHTLVIGVLGVGNMGTAIAKIFKQRKAKVIGFGRRPRIQESHKGDYFDKVVTDLTTVLSDCDYICNVLPCTEETTGLLNGNVLEQCKKKPVFINCGRGNIIKNEDLILALKQKWISGAILDVFETEPLPSESELWTMSQVVITPHLAACSKPSEIVSFFVENYKRFCVGEELISQVDWERGY